MKPIPESSLTETQTKHLRLARRLADLGFDIDKIRGVSPASISGWTRGGSKVLGLFEPQSKLLYITTEALESPFTTTAIVIHELGHHASGGAPDYTDAWAHGMLQVATKLIWEVSQGKLNVGVIEWDYPD